jgi:hypothetical protein
MARRPSPPSFYGGEDKTIQARDHHLHGIRRLVRPPRRRRSRVAYGSRRRNSAMGTADLCTARPSPVRWTGNHLPLGGVGSGTEAIEAKESEPQHGSLPTPKELGARGMDPWLSPLSTFTRLVIILPPGCWRKKREGASPPRTSHGGRR